METLKASFEDGGSGGPNAGQRPSGPEPRPLMRSLWRGARGHCPQCGTGRLFAGYLAVAPTCAVCGEALHHHRADDLPPYLTMLIVGHVVVTGLLVGERLYQPELWKALAFWLPMTAVLALALLRPIKGAVVALQWSLGLHGFAAGARRASVSASSSPTLPHAPETP